MKIPSWMAMPHAAQCRVVEQAEISTSALLSLANLLETLLNSKIFDS
jgi:hypothetical protein